MEKFKLMDIEFYTIKEDDRYYLHIVVPSAINVVYDFSLEEAMKFHQNLGQLIWRMVHETLDNKI